MGMQALRCCSCVHGPKSPPKQSPGVCSAGECTVPGVKGFVTGFPADFPGAVLEPVWVLNESRVFCSSSLWSCHAGWAAISSAGVSQMSPWCCLQPEAAGVSHHADLKNPLAVVLRRPDLPHLFLTAEPGLNPGSPSGRRREECFCGSSRAGTLCRPGSILTSRQQPRGLGEIPVCVSTN